MKRDLEEERLRLTQQAHRAYLNERKRIRLHVRITQLTLLVLFFGLWEWAGRSGRIDTLLFSYPSKIIRLLSEMTGDGSLFPHIGMTVTETVIGFVLGTIMGTAVAVLLWWSPFAERVLDPFIVVLNSMPKVALGPLFIVGLGPGMLSIIGTTLAVNVIITTLVIYASFREVEPGYTKVVRLLGGSRSQEFRKVIFPAAYPAIVSTLKVNVGLSWIGVIVGEFLVSQKGLGYLIVYGFQVFNFTLVLGTLFLIAIVATFMYQAVAWAERKLVSTKQG
ncbi:ABC transporter permease [Gorillibacterium sp. CAU 1737]|uniref:ABC transporter permease n=1 Tax=Gorillibacterium sp. CAU 1737 TaxID=3140362 RepID=UPI0032612932